MKTDFIYRQLAWLYDIPFGLALRDGHVAVSAELRRERPLKVVELGVGQGHSLAFYPTGTHVTGIDLSPNMLAKARQRLKENPKITADLHVMDATATNLPDEAFDMVLSFSVITVVDDPGRLLKEAVRLCKPGGKIVIIGRLQREGLFDKAFRAATHELSLLLFGFGTQMDISVYDCIKDEVEFISRRQVNPVGPITLSDMMVMRKLPKSETRVKEPVASGHEQE